MSLRWTLTLLLLWAAFLMSCATESLGPCIEWHEVYESRTQNVGRGTGVSVETVEPYWHCVRRQNDE